MKSRHNYILVSVIFVLAIFITMWIIAIKNGNMPYLDQWTRGLVSIVAETPIYTVFRWITEFGSKTFVQPMTIIMTVVIWIMFKDFRPAFIFGFGVLGTHFLNNLIKGFVGGH